MGIFYSFAGVGLSHIFACSFILCPKNLFRYLINSATSINGMSIVALIRFAIMA